MRIVLITGGDTGLGFEIVKALYASPDPYYLIIGCQILAKGEAAMTEIRSSHENSTSTMNVVEVELTSDASITAMCNHIASTCGRLDVLVNNAGVNVDREIQNGKLSLREGWAKVWDVNVIGAQVVTTMLMPLLLRSQGARLLFISSGTSALADTERMDRQYALVNGHPAPGWPKEPTINPTDSYRCTKTALNMMMRQWYRVLKHDGVKVFAVAPGFMATGLGNISREELRKMGAVDPSIGGAFVRDVIQGKRDHSDGKVVNAAGIQPW